MATFFLTCLVLGGVILVLQLAFGIADIDHGDHADGDGSVEAGGKDFLHGAHAEGLNLFSARAIAAGVAFFGLGGLAGLGTRLGLLAALPAAIAAGLAAMLFVAFAIRQFGRLEQDNTLVLDRAVGVTGVVYLSIPGERSGAGKVHVTVQERLVELRAVTPQAALPTGASVMVIDVAGPDTVVVVPNPLPHEVS